MAPHAKRPSLRNASLDELRVAKRSRVDEGHDVELPDATAGAEDENMETIHQVSKSCDSSATGLITDDLLLARSSRNQVENPALRWPLQGREDGRDHKLAAMRL